VNEDETGFVQTAPGDTSIEEVVDMDTPTEPNFTTLDFPALGAETGMFTATRLFLTSMAQFIHHPVKLQYILTLSTSHQNSYATTCLTYHEPSGTCKPNCSRHTESEKATFNNHRRIRHTQQIPSDPPFT
jgi:hypothetical protein